MNRESRVKSRGFTVFLWRSMHKPLHRQGHGDGFPNNIRIRLLLCGVGDYRDKEILVVKHKVCRRTHSQDSPSDRLGTRLLGILHRRVCCVPQVEALLSAVLSVPTPLGTLVHLRCLPGRVHELASTNSCNSLALAE